MDDVDMSPPGDALVTNCPAPPHDGQVRPGQPDRVLDLIATSSAAVEL